MEAYFKAGWPNYEQVGRFEPGPTHLTSGHPAALQDSRCVLLVGELVRQLDGFNRLEPGVSGEDEADMAWPGVRSECVCVGVSEVVRCVPVCE